MELVTKVQEVPVKGPGNLVAVGKWDGVHLAHQAILEALVAEGRRTGAQSVAIGFHPLPMAVLRPELAPPMLQTLEERAEVMAGLGLDVHLAIPFDPAFASMSPEAFVQDVLVGQLRTTEVMVGFNWTFGRGGKGTVETLRHLCEPLGIPVRIFDPVRVDGENVSSTEVRFQVAEGRMESAARLLGRPFAITGTVVSGDKLGRKLGFPTANLQLIPGRLLPATGVYVARVTVLGPAEEGALPRRVEPHTGPVYGGMLNLGYRPTLQGKDLRCEVNLFDFAGDLYGQEVRVEFLHRLRGEQSFASLDQLKAQLAADETAARRHLAEHG